MKRRPICVAFFSFLACAFALPARQSSVKVRVRIVLVDKDFLGSCMPSTRSQNGGISVVRIPSLFAIT
jgi:hypothetical protein